MNKVAKFITLNWVVLLVVIGVLYAMNWVKNITSFWTNETTDVVEENDIVLNGTNGYSKIKARSVADGIHIELSKVGNLGVTLIMPFLRDITLPQYNTVYNAFQKRRYNTVTGTDGNPITSDSQDLNYWIRAEIGEDGIGHLIRTNNIFKAIF